MPKAKSAASKAKASAEHPGSSEAEHIEPASDAAAPASPVSEDKEDHVPAASAADITASVSRYFLPSQHNEDKADAKLSPFLRKQKHRLLALRDAMLDSMSGVAQDNLRSRAEGNEASAFGMHQADAGSDAYDRDFALNLLSQEQDALYEIDEALNALSRAPTASVKCPAADQPRAARGYPFHTPHCGMPVAARTAEQGPARASIRHFTLRVDRRGK